MTTLDHADRRPTGARTGEQARIGALGQRAWRHDDDERNLRDRRGRDRRRDDGDAAMHQVVIAVRGIHSRRAGAGHGIIRAVVRCGFGPGDRGFVGIGVGVIVVMIVMIRGAVIVPVLRVVPVLVLVVIVRELLAVGVRREHAVQTQVHVRSDLEAEHPQHHEGPSERASLGCGDDGHRRPGLAEYSELVTAPRGVGIGEAGAIRVGDPCVWRPTAR